MRKNQIIGLFFLAFVLCMSACKEQGSHAVKLKVEKKMFPSKVKFQDFLMDTTLRDRGVGGISVMYGLDLPADFSKKHPQYSYELIRTLSAPDNTVVFADTAITQYSGTKTFFIPYNQLYTFKKGVTNLKFRIEGNYYKPADSIHTVDRKRDAEVIVSGNVKIPEVRKTALMLLKLETDTTRYSPSEMDFSLMWGSGYPDLFWEATICGQKIFTSEVCKNQTNYCRKDTTSDFYYVLGDTMHLSVYDFDAISYHDLISTTAFPIDALRTPMKQNMTFEKIKILTLRPKP